MAISLVKRHHDPVRWDAAAEDHDWAMDGRPLWWDDASYIRYQSDDGPAGYWVNELAFLPAHTTPIVRHWVSYDIWDEDTAFPSRRIRSLLASFGDIRVHLASSGEADREVLHAAHPIPF